MKNLLCVLFGHKTKEAQWLTEHIKVAQYRIKQGKTGEDIYTKFDRYCARCGKPNK
jgi:hypothetical protein